jgi:hypothetical protein
MSAKLVALNAVDAAAAIDRGDGKAIEGLHKELRTVSVEEATRVLTELVRHRNPVVRGWVTFAAPPLLGRAAAPLLDILAEDRDTDVQTEAMDELVKLDRRYASKWIPRYFALARGKDSLYAIYGMLRLTRYRVPGAVEVFRDLADAAHPAIRNHANVLSLVLEGREDDLIHGLQQDDHTLISIWIKGALYLGTQRTIDALESVSQTDVHPACRERARDALKKKAEVAPLPMN